MKLFGKNLFLLKFSPQYYDKSTGFLLQPDAPPTDKHKRIV